MFDKGQHNFLCKRLAWWSDSDRRVNTVLLDVDKCGGTSKECAKSIVHSLRKITGMNNLTIRIVGQMTDSGGGGPSSRLQRTLNILESQMWNAMV